jgi:hypothetical protein
MKSLNGILFILIGGIVIWIGATGRLPALAAALGMIKNTPGSSGGTAKANQNAVVNFGDVASGSSSTANAPGLMGQVAGANAAAYKAIANANGDFYYNVLGLK